MWRSCGVYRKGHSVTRNLANIGESDGKNVQKWMDTGVIWLIVRIMASRIAGSLLMIAIEGKTRI